MTLGGVALASAIRGARPLSAALRESGRRRVAHKPVALSSQQSFDSAPSIQKGSEISLPIGETIESDQFLILLIQSSRFPASPSFCDPEV